MERVYIITKEARYYFDGLLPRDVVDEILIQMYDGEEFLEEFTLEWTNTGSLRLVVYRDAFTYLSFCGDLIHALSNIDKTSRRKVVENILNTLGFKDVTEYDYIKEETIPFGWLP